MSGTDPATGAPYAEGYAGLPAELAALQGRAGGRRRRSAAGHLVAGHRDRRTEAAQLAGRTALRRRPAPRRRRPPARRRIRSAAEGSRPVGDGLARLAAGATVLAAGIARLTGGDRSAEPEPQRGLQPLLPAAGRPAPRLGPHHLDRLVAQAPRRPGARADSGPLRLGLLRPLGARRRPAPLRDRAAEGIDLENSGQAATLLVFSRYAFNSPGSIAFNKRLNGDAATLGREAGLTTGVAGGPATAQRLQPRHPGTDPAGRRRDHPRHLPGPDPDPPLAAAGGDRGRAQPGDRRRRLRRPHPALRRPRRAGRWAATPTSTRSARR